MVTGPSWPSSLYYWTVVLAIAFLATALLFMPSAIPPVTDPSTSVPPPSPPTNTMVREGEETLEPTRAHESTFYPIPAALAEATLTPKTYEALVGEADADWSAWWLKQARSLLSWTRMPERSWEGDMRTGAISWFADGLLNVAYNCIDRHPAERVAILWEGDEPGQGRSVTYGELRKLTSQLAWYLRAQGVTTGDTVAIYMPMIPETVVAMLACARLGAMHNVVFAGFSAESLADRLIDSRARIILTADEGVRGGKRIPLKATVDAALVRCQAAGHDHIQRVLVYSRTGAANIPWDVRRDQHWHHVLTNDTGAKGDEKEMDVFEPVPLPAEHPLFMLYTSGSTGKPKGLVHTAAGYLLYAALTHRHVFDYHPGDIYGCLADVGWITGHTYIVYGPLANGATTVLFESTPTYPTASRYWDVVQRLHLTQLYTAPTVIRALKRFGNEPLAGYDLSSLRVIGTVGEPINPEAWIWYHEQVGGKRAAVVDTYWQTETGGHVITPIPGALRTKAGSAARPFFGLQAEILDQGTGVPLRGANVDGVLVMARPWPGMARTIFGDHEKFINTYYRPYPGYYFTGDRAYRDGDGYYWIRGRVDDVINVSGHRLSTAEIEAALGRHPHCAEAAVLGRPDPITGQSIWAFCIIKPAGREVDPATLEAELILAVRRGIGAFAAPRRVLLVEDLPKTRSGKIMRRVIRKILEGVTDLSALGDITTLNNPGIVRDIVEAVRHADQIQK